MASANPNPPKDKALEDEERIEAALDHLDQVHLQASLLLRHIDVAPCSSC